MIFTDKYSKLSLQGKLIYFTFISKNSLSTDKISSHPALGKIFHDTFYQQLSGNTRVLFYFMTWSAVFQEYKRFLLFHSYSLSAIIQICGRTFSGKYKKFLFFRLCKFPLKCKKFFFFGKLDSFVSFGLKVPFSLSRLLIFWGRKVPFWNIRMFSLKSSISQI